MNGDFAPRIPPAAQAPTPAATPRARDDLPLRPQLGHPRPLDRRVLPLWWVTGALILLPLLVPLLVADRAAPHPLPDGLPTLLIAVVGAAMVIVLPLMRYRRWRYALREDDLWVQHGVLTVTVSVVPYRRLQFVDTKQGPLDRLFGLAQLMVHTAALGTSAHLPGLDAAQAEELRERLASLEPDDPVA